MISSGTSKPLTVIVPVAPGLNSASTTSLTGGSHCAQVDGSDHRRQTASALTDVWLRGVAERPWDAPPVWVHGDLHPGNLVADGARLVAIIDFGDVTAGDPAYDLAVAWLAFDAAGRSAFLEATGDRHDRATWIRAHAWAASIAVVLLAHSDDNPDYARLGADAADEVLAAASPA